MEEETRQYYRLYKAKFSVAGQEEYHAFHDRKPFSTMVA
jgi:hypothetical protein